MGVTVQQHHICFAVSRARLAVIGLLVCTSTLRRPLARICGSSEAVAAGRLLLWGCLSLFFDFRDITTNG